MIQVCRLPYAFSRTLVAIFGTPVQRPPEGSVGAQAAGGSSWSCGSFRTAARPRWALRLRSASRSLTQTGDQQSKRHGSRRTRSCHSGLSSLKGPTMRKVTA